MTEENKVETNEIQEVSISIEEVEEALKTYEDERTGKDDIETRVAFSIIKFLANNSFKMFAGGAIGGVALNLINQPLEATILIITAGVLSSTGPLLKYAMLPGEHLASNLEKRRKLAKTNARKELKRKQIDDGEIKS